MLDILVRENGADSCLPRLLPMRMFADSVIHIPSGIYTVM
jgi:hypothetical protein